MATAPTLFRVTPTDIRRTFGSPRTRVALGSPRTRVDLGSVHTYRSRSRANRHSSRTRARVHRGPAGHRRRRLTTSRPGLVNGLRRRVSLVERRATGRARETADVCTQIAPVERFLRCLGAQRPQTFAWPELAKPSPVPVFDNTARVPVCIQGGSRNVIAPLSTGEIDEKRATRPTDPCVVGGPVRVHVPLNGTRFTRTRAGNMKKTVHTSAGKIGRKNSRPRSVTEKLTHLTIFNKHCTLTIGASKFMKNKTWLNPTLLKTEKTVKYAVKNVQLKNS